MMVSSIVFIIFSLNSISLKKRLLFDIQITVIITEMDSCGVICESHGLSLLDKQPEKAKQF